MALLEARRRIPVKDQRLEVPGWLNALTLGGAANPKVAEAVIIYHAALDAEEPTHIKTVGNEFGLTVDHMIRDRDVADRLREIKRAKKAVPLWVIVYEALPG